MYFMKFSFIFSNFLAKSKLNPLLVSIEIGKKVLHTFDNVFHIYLINGLQKYKKSGFLR